MATLSSEQFNEIEKRQASHKFVFGVQQLDAFKRIDQEELDTSFATFADELISGEILVTNTDPKPVRISTWVTESFISATSDQLGVGTQGTIWTGSFSQSITTNTENPNVEEIIMPLLNIDGTNNQGYAAYVISGSTYKDISEYTSANYNTFNINAGEKLVLSGSNRVKNFINPAKFGLGYTATIFACNSNFTAPGASELVVDSTSTTANRNRGGWIFDYKNGILYIAVDPNNDSPNLSNFQHPLWIKAYRYIGPTGSVALATTASFALNAGSSGASTTPGITHTLMNPPSTANSSVNVNSLNSYNIDENDWYINNSLLPTNSEDIIEYVSPDGALILSGTLGQQNLIFKLGSASFNDITRQQFSGYGDTLGDTQVDNDGDFNGVDLFSWNTGSGKKFADLSSYGLFNSPQGSEYTTHSFNFSEEVRLQKMSLYFSNSDTTDIKDFTPSYNLAGLRYPAGYELHASNDSNSNFVLIASASGIEDKIKNSEVSGALYYLNVDNLPNREGELSSNLFISNVTSSEITNDTRYQYYRLYVSGGVKIDNFPVQYQQALHHVDLWRNLDFGESNRKQINIKLNDTLVGQVGPLLDQLTEFDLIVSESARKLGYFSGSVVSSGFTNFAGGVLSENMTFEQTDGSVVIGDIQHVNAITSSIVSASNISTGHLTATSSDFLVVTASTLLLNDSLTLNGQLKMPSNQPIFFTDKSQTGSPGVDEFSARIFGHYTNAGVSDLYLDAYRIYSVADAQITLKTLNETYGKILLNSPLVDVSGSMTVTGSVTASAFKGDGSGLTGIVATDWNGTRDGDAQISGELNLTTMFVNHITASGDISSSGGRFIGDGSGLTNVTADQTEWDGTINANAHISGTLNISSSNSLPALHLNGNTISSGSILISGSIIPNVNDTSQTSSFSLGSETAAWRDIHVSEGTIKFYRAGGSSVADISVNNDGSIQFTTGSSLAPATVKELFIGGTTGSNGVTLSDDGRGFISVHNNGQHSTILRAEDQSLPNFGLSTDSVHGSLTQKGSGSFAIILDAVNQNAARSKFSVISNSEIFDIAQVLFQVSESGETRVYGHLTVDNHITASNVSASGIITAAGFNLTDTSLNIINVTASANISASGTIIASNLSGTNTGDQNLSSYIQNSDTASFSTIVQLNASSSALNARITSLETNIDGGLF